MAAPAVYLPKYEESRALIIGVNKYRYAGPLMHACNDAQAVAAQLIDRFKFPKANVDLLLDADATRASIMDAFHRYTNSAFVKPDDRIVVFYAGHGHTVTGRRGETGFLVPVDGDVSNLASLIHWDELTRNADLIAAKHMLFLMDACYGGLALTRTTIPPGSMRFLKDMLQRYSRQVLTAGKADEVVSDAGGTRSGHSIFTSHLLDGLEGAAAPAGGIVTGHGLMAYVYSKVGSDPHSRQTPHFGFFDGDGDFIFDTSLLATLHTRNAADPAGDRDVFIESPSFPIPNSTPAQQGDLSETLKHLIASPGERIKLNDLISALLRRVASDLGQEHFLTSGAVTKEEFALRLQRYEDAISDLLVAVVLLAYWGDEDQTKLLEKIFARVAELEKPQGGTVVWLRLNWYPVLLMMYAAGIAALAAGKFGSLRAALLTKIYSERRRESNRPIVLPTIEELTEIVETFKILPDMERKYVPRSEHIYKKLQPLLEDQLFLGRSYDALFDQFEILLALSFGDLRNDDVTAHVWGPPGRFAWKERGRLEDAAYSRFVSEAKAEGQEWGPLAAGFFRKSAKRFADVADAYGQLLARINWW
jgi:Caspase domain